ncbi:MAG: ATPase domain-containing protein [Promethearchaeota archaeon]
MIFPTSQLRKFFNQSKVQEGIVSVYGDTGVGKTTFALQTLMNTRISGKNVLFIYTKHKFPSSRLYDLAERNRNRLDELLEKTLIINTPNFKDLRKITFNLDFLIADLLKEINFVPNVIIIDSITDLYKLDLNMESKEKNIALNYELNQILANLQYLKEIHNLEILLVNDISRKELGDTIIEVQSGGKVMDYWIEFSIKITRSKSLNQRYIELTKSPSEQKLKFTSRLSELGFE